MEDNSRIFYQKIDIENGRTVSDLLALVHTLKNWEKGGLLKVLISIILMFTLLNASLVYVGSVKAAPIVVTIDLGRSITSNEFGVGLKLDYEWELWRDSLTLREMAEDVNVKLIAFHAWKSNTPNPCRYWSESSKTGTFDWDGLDSLIRRIKELGAEPLMSLTGYDMSSQYLPQGMATNPRTGLPYPESWAAYCAEWVRHFKSVGLSVKYYEITTEPFKYFGWTADLTKLGYYVELWNAAAKAMRTIDSKIMLSHDFITAKRVLDYWVKYGEDIDFLDFHKYDSYSLSSRSQGYLSDSELLRRAETSRFVTTDGGTYGVEEAQQIWEKNRGKLLPVINSECNLNSYWRSSTDPRIQKMIGAVWTALMLRTSVLEGVQYSTYFHFGSYPSYTSTGSGFGLINLENYRPWYPYYPFKWIGSNLDLGDPILHCTSSSEDIRPLTWINGNNLNLLIICKVDQDRSLNLQGIQGSIKYYKIDDTFSFTNPQIQTGTINPSTTIYLKGYTVMLLQTDTSSPPPSTPPSQPPSTPPSQPPTTPPPTSPSESIFTDDFESRDFRKWTGTSTTTGETATIANYQPYSGNYHARFTTNGGGKAERAYLIKDISDTSEIHVQSYVYVQGGLPLKDQSDRFNIIAIQGSRRDWTTASVCVQRINGMDRWTIRSIAGNWYASTGPSMYQWYRVECYVKTHSSSGIYRLWINGQLLIEKTGLNTASEGIVDSVRFGLTYVNGITTSLKIYGDTCTISKIGMTSPPSSPPPSTPPPSTPPPTSPSESIFADDFESRDFRKWTGTSTTTGETATIANNQPYSGNYHARFTTNGGGDVDDAYCYETVNEGTLHVKGYFYIAKGLPLNDDNDRFYFLRLRAGGQSIAGVGIRRYNGLERWMVYGRDGSKWVWPTYVVSPSIRMNKWYCLELYWHRSRTAGRIEVYVDGQKIFEISQINTAYYGYVDSVQLGIIHAASVQQDIIAYVDSCLVSEE